MTPSAPPTVTPERLMQFAFGYAPTLIIEAAIRNRVFDVLDEKPLTLAEVAAATGASERGLRAIMNALVGLNFLTKDGDSVYALAPESAAFLVSTKPSFQGGIFRHASTQLMPPWLSLTEVVRTGKSSQAVNQESVGSEFFIELVQDIFPLSYRPAQVLAEVLGLPGAASEKKVLDIAAGSGVWGIALAQASGHVSVTAVDWPNVLEVTRKYAARFGLAEKFSYVAGDILDIDYGSGFDVATLGHILHSEGVDRSKRLLKKVFDALAPGGVISIAEMVPDDDRTGPPYPLIFAVNMLVNTDEGDTFTFSEISSWLSAVGFDDIRQVAAPGPSPLILATKPA